MFPMPTPQMPQYSPTPSLFSGGMFHGSPYQLSNFPVQQGALGQSSGLISKLFGGAAQAGGSNITNIVSMLQNAQKAIGLFQQVAPLVQQYGPLVKSLPTLISIMKDNSSSNEEPSVSEETSEVENKETSEEALSKTPEPNKSDQEKKRNNKTEEKNSKRTPPNYIAKGIPAPKLYI